MSSSAVILHCASCRIFVGLPLTFLKRVSSSNLRFDISHLSTSSQKGQRSEDVAPTKRRRRGPPTNRRERPQGKEPRTCRLDRGRFRVATPAVGDQSAVGSEACYFTCCVILIVLRFAPKRYCLDEGMKVINHSFNVIIKKLLNNFCISCVDERLTGCSPDRATHGRPTFGHRCTVGVLAGTHRCDDSSRQDDESPMRQPYSAALH